jgi:hypothetical protein
MAFNRDNLFQVWSGSLSNGRGAGWSYETTVDSSGTVLGAGYFAGAMRASRGVNGMGCSTGDWIHVNANGTRFLAQFTGSTANQASTLASTGYSAAYNGTIAA